MPDDRAEIEAVVQEVVEGVTRDDPSPDPYTGPLAQAAAVDMHIHDRGGWKSRYFPADIRKLNVLSVGGDEATVELDARIHVTSNHPVLGKKQRSIRLNGPVALRRENGAWRVETFKSGGVDLRSALFRPVPAEIDVHDVRIAAFAQLWHKHRVLKVLVQNQSHSEVVVERVVAVSRIWWLFEDGGFVRRNPSTLAPSASLGSELALKPRWRSVPLLLNCLVDGREVELRLDAPAHVGFLQRLRSNVWTIVFFAAVLGGIVLWALGLSPRLLAMFLLFTGVVQLLSVGVDLLRGPVLSVTALYAAAGLAELTGAVVLLRLHPVDMWSLVLALATLGFVFARQFQLALHERRADASDAT